MGSRASQSLTRNMKLSAVAKKDWSVQTRDWRSNYDLGNDNMDLWVEDLNC